MWINVVAIYVTGILSVASFVAAACLSKFSNTPFALNIFYGVFGSSFLSLCLSIINYWHERNNTLAHFLQEARKIQRQFNSYPHGGTAPEKMAAITRISQYDTESFYDYYSEIHFLFCNKKKMQQIQLRIYFPIDLAFHYVHVASNAYNLYASSGNQPNEKMQEKLIHDIDRMVVGDYSKEHMNCGNKHLLRAATYNRFASDLHNELETYYYDSVLYFYKKKRGTR